MNNDVYGRTISVVTGTDIDTYTIMDSTLGTQFDVVFPSGTALPGVYNTINAMAPSWYVPPPDTTDGS